MSWFVQLFPWRLGDMYLFEWRGDYSTRTIISTNPDVTDELFEEIEGSMCDGNGLCGDPDCMHGNYNFSSRRVQL